MSVPSDLLATQRVMLDRLKTLMDAHMHWNQMVEHHQKQTAEATANRDIVRDSVSQLLGAGEQLGFNLWDVWREADTPTGDAPPPAPIARAEPGAKVKDLVLQCLKEAHPNSLKAVDIRAKIEAAGHSIHPKTVGMNLYRWSKSGAVRREDDDWFFVPEGERKRESAQLTLVAAE